jgi:hypothetical protein
MHEDVLARETCAKFLTAAQLKDICNYRGFGAPPVGKDQLAAYVAARFNGSYGVAAAMRSLDETCLAILHFVAMSEYPPTIAGLDRLLHRDRHYGSDSRGIYNFIAAGLLNRGVVLIHDTLVTRYSGESRYARLALVIPEAHRPFIPTFPVAAEPLGPDSSRLDAPAFLRQALALAIDRAVCREQAPSDTLLQRVASLFSFENGILTIGGKEPSGIDAVFKEARHLWAHPASAKQRTLDKKAATAVLHILAHLPEKHGCTLQALERGVVRLGLKIDLQELAQFCDDGWQAGFLWRGGAPDSPCYAAAAPAGRSAAAPLVFSADEHGIVVDAVGGDLEGCLELALVSRAEVSDRRLRLVPDALRMGRAAARIEASPAIAAARGLCPAYESAARHVLERRDRVILHEGLALFRADDLGLRTQLLHRFHGSIRSLSGPYLASPRELREEIENFCLKQGFAPRKLP